MIFEMENGFSRKNWETLRKLIFGIWVWNENQFLKEIWEFWETNFWNNSRNFGKIDFGIWKWNWEYGNLGKSWFELGKYFEISFKNSEFWENQISEKDLEIFGKIDFSEIELGKEFENNANWMNEYEFEREFHWGIGKSFWVLRNAVHFWS